MKSLLCGCYLMFYMQISRSNYTFDRCAEILSDGRKEWFCCDNKEDVNGVCKECKHGYHSERGEPCRPCSIGSYGRKCADICNCEDNYRCDHVIGCTTEKLGTTTFPQVKGLLVREIFIYTLVPLTFLIIGVVSVLCIRYYQQRSQNNSVSQQNNVVEQRMERRYDSIDELNMSDVLPQNINTINNSNEPNNEMKHVVNSSAGYLDPVLSDTESLMNSTSEEGHSESSETENTLRGSGYLHPYQPIVTDEDVHKYDSKTNDDDITVSKLKVVVSSQSDPSEPQEIKEDSISLNCIIRDHSES